MRIEDTIYSYSSVVKPSGPAGPKGGESAETGIRPQGRSFEEVLGQLMPAKELTFSKHAMQRIEDRGIDLSKEDLKNLQTAVQKAETKGVGNTLILSEKGAFIVNVSSHVVITAMNQKDMKENIFTQIDGAVVI